MTNILEQTSKFNWEENYKHNNLPWLKDRTIYITVHGSTSYGTNIEGSDIDYRGIAIPPKEYFFGVLNKFDNVVQKDPDLTIFNIRKFFYLCLENNPNALEILFVEPDMHQLTTPAFWKIYENRELFLSKNAKYRLSGYAFAQLKRIRLHRAYTLSPPDHEPTRAEFGLPDRMPIPKDQLEAAESAIKKRMDEWSWKDLEEVEPATRQMLKDLFQERILEITKWDENLYEDKLWKCAVNGLGFDSNFIEFLDKERLYKNKKREWKQYLEWQKNRNPIRAELERKMGFDGKHGLHVVRLIKTCKELLLTGKYNVKRPDAKELLSIRNGEWTYDQLVEWAQKEIEEIEMIFATSTLRYEPERKMLNKILMEIIEESF
jgi:predicted nucleotidyltransferase